MPNSEPGFADAVSGCGSLAKGVETSEKLGRHRWVIERTISWLTGYPRLTIRYERNTHHFLAFLTLAAAITCFKRLQQLTT